MATPKPPRARETDGDDEQQHLLADLDLDALLIAHLRKRAPGLSAETLAAAFAAAPPPALPTPSSSAEAAASAAAS
jgi:hypothetical protein